MKKGSRMLRRALIVGALCVATAAVGSVAWAMTSATDKIVACAKKSNGDLRLVAAVKDCRKTERAVVWSANGQQGPRGPVGPRGPAGEDGADGVDGLDGDDGDDGEDGFDGDDGVDGEDGATGPAGPIGPIGPYGPAGATGPIGPIGPYGPAGAQGPAGGTGAIGPAGPAGPASEPKWRYVSVSASIAPYAPGLVPSKSCIDEPGHPQAVNGGGYIDQSVVAVAGAPDVQYGSPISRWWVQFGIAGGPYARQVTVWVLCASGTEG